MRGYRLAAAIVAAVLAAIVACGSVSGPKEPPDPSGNACVVDKSKIGECTL